MDRFMRRRLSCAMSPIVTRKNDFANIVQSITIQKVDRARPTSREIRFELGKPVGTDFPQECQPERPIRQVDSISSASDTGYAEMSVASSTGSIVGWMEKREIPGDEVSPYPESGTRSGPDVAMEEGIPSDQRTTSSIRSVSTRLAITPAG